MPGNDFDQEALLSFVSELTKRVEDLKREIGSIGAQAGTGMKKITDETEKLGQTLDRDTRSLKAMKDQGSGLVGVMRGASGLGLAFYGAAQAMENFARNELSLRNFATDVRMTSGEVNKLRTQLSASGIDASAANQQLGALSAKLDSIRIYQTASPVYKAIAANDPILAKQLLDAEKIGNRMKSMDAIRERWNTGPRSRLYITEQLGVTQSTMEALEKNRTGLVQPWEYSDAELEKYNREWTNIMTNVANFWGASMMKMTAETNKFTEQTQAAFGGLTEWFKTLGKGFDLEGLQKGDKPKSIPDLFGFGDSGSGTPQRLSPEAEASAQERVAHNTAYNEWHRRLSSELFPQGIGWEKWRRSTNVEDYSETNTAGRFKKKEEDKWSGKDIYLPWKFSEKLNIQKDSNQSLQDIRDLLRGESGSGGPQGVGGAGFGGGDGAGADNGPGGQAQVRDEAGNPIDQETMKLAEGLGRNGDTAGLQKLFASRGYRMSGAACGIVASKYARAAGFEPPKSGAIATSWHRWGEQSSAEDVNKPDRPFGSIMGTYYHRRYGGNPNEVLRPGQTGGHVMTIVPGSYDPQTGTVGVVDQYGFKRRSVKDIDFRYAGAEAVKEAERIRTGKQPDQDGDRKRIDSSFPGMRTDRARVDVEFNGVPKGVKTDAELLEQGVFNTLNVKKSQQSPQPN